MKLCKAMLSVLLIYSPVNLFALTCPDPLLVKSAIEKQQDFLDDQGFHYTFLWMDADPSSAKISRLFFTAATVNLRGPYEGHPFSCDYRVIYETHENLTLCLIENNREKQVKFIHFGHDYDDGTLTCKRHNVKECPFELKKKTQ